MNVKQNKIKASRLCWVHQRKYIQKKKMNAQKIPEK